MNRDRREVSLPACRWVTGFEPGEVLFLFNEAITNSRFGQEKRRPAWIRLDFLPQARHIHTKIMALIFGIRPPNFPEQEAMGEHLSRMSHQQTQQVVFSRRE